LISSTFSRLANRRINIPTHEKKDMQHPSKMHRKPATRTSSVENFSDLLGFHSRMINNFNYRAVNFLNDSVQAPEKLA
jgi:hypothetical protein